MNIRLDDIQFFYEPYPIGLARSVIATADYAEMVDNWPPQDLFLYLSTQGNKFGLSELHHPRQYQAFVRSHRVWRDFHAFIKTRGFINQTLRLLCRHNIDLGLDSGLAVSSPHLGPSKHVWQESIKSAVEQIRRCLRRHAKLDARFEFAMMPADGGSIRPHTDAITKVITLVLPVLREGKWDPEFGGGTAVVRPKDVTRRFNYVNRYMDFDEVETVSTLPFQPNQCVVFIKTFNSWHAVHPMRGVGSTTMRKTVNVNIVLGE